MQCLSFFIGMQREQKSAMFASTTADDGKRQHLCHVAAGARHRPELGGVTRLKRIMTRRAAGGLREGRDVSLKVPDHRAALRTLHQLADVLRIAEQPIEE
jgi:hypothetical protein